MGKCKKIFIGLFLVVLLIFAGVKFSSSPLRAKEKQTETTMTSPVESIESNESSLAETDTLQSKDSISSEEKDAIREGIEESSTGLENEQEAKLEKPLTRMAVTSAITVTDWQSFVEALSNPSVTQIDLGNDIVLSGTLNNYNDLFNASSKNIDTTGNNFFYVSKSGTARSLVINGNNHTFNFGSLAIGFLNSSSNSNYWNLSFKNVNFISSNDSGPFTLVSHSGASVVSEGLTGTSLSNASITYDGNTSTNKRQVNSFGKYMIALCDPFITTIELTDDLVSESGSFNPRYYVYNKGTKSASAVPSYSGNNSGGTSTLNMGDYGTANNVHDFIVDGQGHTIDFGAIRIYFTAAWNFTLKNIVTYHGNYYGPMMFSSSAKGSLTYDDYTGYGTQFIESQSGGRVVFKNNVSLTQVVSYDSLKKDGSVIRNWRPNNTSQQTLRVADAKVEDNANVYLHSRGSTVLYTDSGGAFTIGKNAKVKIVRENGATGSESDWVNMQINGNVTVGEGSKLDVINNSTRNAGAVEIASTNAKITVEKNASMNIVMDSYTGNGANNGEGVPLYLASNGELRVFGALSVNGKNMNTGSANMIYGSNNSTFVIESQGSFDVKSDSASTNQYLIYMYGSGSTFEFTDAQRVNLQRTVALSGGNETNNGLIYSGGKLDVSVQNVYQWTLGKGIGVTEDTGYTYEYAPMSSMTLDYRYYTPTISKANAMTNDTLTRFKNNFSTRGQQRVLFTRVPGPNVSIKSVANDNHNDAASRTIYGFATPNTYIRLWEEALNGTVSAKGKGDGDTIKSPVEDTGMPSDTRNNYTVQADKDGNWTYTLPNGKYFATGNIIHVYAFSNLKSEELTQTVLDKTPPTGEGVTFVSYVGSDLPSAEKFVKNVKDTNPIAQKFTYEYVDKSAAQALLLSENVAGAEVPIYVYDEAGNRATITGTLVVYQNSVDINATSPIEFSYVDVRDLTSDDFKTEIIKKSNAIAHKIENGVLTKFDKITDFTVTDLGALTNLKNVEMNKEYPVTISCPSIGKTIVVNVSLIPSTVSMSINQVYSDGKTPIYNNLTTKTTVDNSKKYEVTIGDDLVTELNKLVSTNSFTLNYDGYNNLAVTDYQVKVNEQLVESKTTIVPDTDFTIIFTYVGQFKFKETATQLKFGDVTISGQTSTTPLTSDSDAGISIINTLQNANWHLKVAIPNGIKRTDGSDETFKGAIVFKNSSGGSKTIGTATTLLDQQDSDELVSQVDLRGTNSGLYLQQETGNLNGSYKGELVWTLEDAP